MSNRTCSVEDCDNPHDSHGFCGKHRYGWKKYGDPLFMEHRVQIDRRCSVEDCNEAYRAKGFCRNHYYAWQTHGDPLIDGRRRSEELVCAVDDCDDPYLAKGFCSKHYQRWKKSGDPLAPRYAKTPGYAAAHWRVKYKFGSANLYLCVDCGQSAKHWSYEGSPDEVVEEFKGKVLRYSLNPDDYSARCVPCHKRHDLRVLGGGED